MNRNQAKLVVYLGVVALVASLLLVGSPSARAYGGAVTFQAIGGGAGTCASVPCQFSSITVAGSDTLVLSYMTTTGNLQANITSRTCGAYTLTRYANFTGGTFGSNFYHVYLFYLAGMAPGSYSCFVNYTGGSAASIDFISWEESWSSVSQTSPIAQAKRAFGTTNASTMKVTFSSTPGSKDYMADFVQVLGGGGAAYPSAGTGQTAMQQAGQGAPEGTFTSRSRKAGGTNATMYWGESGTVDLWSQYAVDIASNFIVSPADPSSNSRGYWWSTNAQWAGGTFSNTVLSGNCIALALGSTTGTWTSALVTASGVLAGVNLTYAGGTVARYVSNVAVLDSSGNVIWQNPSAQYTNGGANLSASSIPVTSWELRLTFVGDGVSSISVCLAGVQLNAMTLGSSPPFDWLPYLVVAVVFVVIAVLIVAWRYLA